MSATATWIMCIVIVGSLIGMLSVITLASRHPAFKSPRVPSMQGPVLGGMHLAEGGRSVAPDRDAPPELTDTELRWIEDVEAGHPVTEHPETEHPEASRPEVPVQRMPTEPAQRSDQAEQAAPLPGPGPSDAEQTTPLPRQRSGQADRSEKTTTDR